MNGILEYELKFLISENPKVISTSNKCTPTTLQNNILSKLRNPPIDLQIFKEEDIKTAKTKLNFYLDHIINYLVSDKSKESQDSSQININTNNLRCPNFFSLCDTDYTNIEIIREDFLSNDENSFLISHETPIKLKNKDFTLLSITNSNDEIYMNGGFPHDLRWESFNEVYGIRHPFIQNIHSKTFNKEKNESYLILKNIEGNTLEEIITTNYFEKNITDNRKWQILYEICEILDFLNTLKIPYIHLNPKNIIIDKFNKIHFKLIGFFNLCDLRTVFDAPEIISNNIDKNRSNSAIYSFGNLAYFIFNELHPFNNELINYEQAIKNSNSELLETTKNQTVNKLIELCCSLDRHVRISARKAKYFIIINNPKLFYNHEHNENEENYSNNNNFN